MKKLYTLGLGNLALVAALSLTNTKVHAQAATQLATYTFTGATGSEATFPADAQPSNASFSAMSRGAGVTASAGANAFVATGWATMGLDATDYFTFTIQPNTGFQLRLDSLVLDERRSGTGIRDWAVRSSLDNYTANIVTVNVPDDDMIRANRRVTLPVAFSALTTPVTFRIYGYNAEAAGGSWRIDNVRTYGLIRTATLGTRNGASNSAISMFPNPANDVLSIRVNGKGTKVPVTVTDLTGRTVLSGTATADGTFDLRSLPAGSYIVLVKDGVANSSYKIVKQ